MTLRRVILWPLGLAFGGITGARRSNFERGGGQRFSVPVLVVGNLSTGGTGKTPLCDAVLSILTQANCQPALVSRGYGRQTKGFLDVQPDTAPNAVGDEPLLLKRRHLAVPMAVCEDRAQGISRILKQNPETKAVVLDDGLQHFGVRPDCRIVLTTYQNPFWNDAPLPAGNLREPRKSARIATCIVVTKCPPNLSEAESNAMASKMRKYASCPLFFATIAPGTLVWQGDAPQAASVIALSAIADASVFERELRTQFSNVHPMRFADHHAYTLHDVQRIIALANEKQSAVVATEKDSVKLAAFHTQFLEANVALAYLPITVSFLLAGGPAFRQLLLRYARCEGGT